MNTYRETILQAVVDRLLVSGVPAFRSRAIAFDRTELPAVVVKPGGEQATRLANRLMSRAFRIIVEVHGIADSSCDDPVTADQQADEVIVKIHAALFGTDETLGGIVGSLLDVEMQEPVFVDADETRVATTLIYLATYATAVADLSRTTNH